MLLKGIHKKCQAHLFPGVSPKHVSPSSFIVTQPWVHVCHHWPEESQSVVWCSLFRSDLR